MWRRLGDYVLIVGKLWGSQVSGPVLAVVTIVLLIIGLFINNPTYAAKFLNWAAASTGALAILLVVAAQYEAWSLERGKYEAEVKRIVSPDIRGSFSNLNFFDGQALYGFDLTACNHSTAITNIRDVFAHVAYVDGESQVVRVSLAPDGTSTRLEFGIEHPIRAIFACSRPLYVMRVKVRLIDGLGKEHAIPYQGPQPMKIQVERADDAPLVILYKARWCLSSFRYKNRLKELQGYFEAGIEVTASNQCFGDPYFRKNKYLRVMASIDGGRTRKWYTFREGDRVQFLPSKTGPR